MAVVQLLQDAMANPGCLDWYVAFAQRRLAAPVQAPAALLT